MKKGSLLIIVLLLYTIKSYSTELWYKPILQVKVEPEVELEPGLLSSLLPGQLLTPDKVITTIEKLYNTARFVNIELYGYPMGNGVVVIISLNPKLKIVAVNFKGNRYISQTRLKEIIKYEELNYITVEDITRMEERIREYYKKRGFPSITLETGVKPIEKSYIIELLFKIDEGTPTTINKIYIEGDFSLSKWRIQERLGVGEGDILDLEKIEKGIKEIYDYFKSNYFFNAKVTIDKILVDKEDPTKANLYIKIIEGPKFYFIFRGNRVVPKALLLNALNLDEEESLSYGIIKELGYRVQSTLIHLGFYQAKVSTSLKKRGKTLFIIFDIREGEQLIVKEIIIKGSRYFSPDYLKGQIFGVIESISGSVSVFEQPSTQDIVTMDTYGFLKVPWKQEPKKRFIKDITKLFVEDYYKEAIEHLKKLYQSEGFLYVKIKEPKLIFLDEKQTKANVIIEVIENRQVIVRSITFMGNQKISSDELEKTILFETGSPFKRQQVLESKDRIKKYYMNRGYYYVVVEMEEIQFKDEGVTDIIFKIVEGPKVHIKDIQIKGATNVSSSLIRDQLVFKVGDIFTPELVRKSEQNILALGIIRSVNIELDSPQEVKESKTVVVNINEAPEQYLEIKAGFSSADGPRGKISYGHRNLFSYAIEFDINFQINYQIFFLGQKSFEEYFYTLPLIDRLERYATLGIGTTQLPKLRQLLGLRLDLVHQRMNEPAYSLDRNSIYISLLSRIRHYLNIQLQTGVEFNGVDVVKELPLCNELIDEEPKPRVNCLTLQDLQNLKLPKGDSTFFVTKFNSSLNLTDSLLNPTKGFWGGLSLEYAYGIGEQTETEGKVSYYNSNLFKLLISLKGYIPLLEKRVSLALNVKWGRIFHLTPTSQTFPDRLFYMGGVDTIRGFPEQSLKAWDIGEPGGNTMINLRAEFRFLVVGNLYGGIFLDSGNLWREPSSFNITELRYALGLGLRYLTPIGPIVLDYGFNLRPKSEYKESIGSFHFSIGLF